MGNYVSCTLSGPAMKQSRGIKIIFPRGEIRHFYQPMKAAEPMLEMPGFFLVNTKSLQIGRRFSALNADEDLEIANVYVMFPMKRVNSVVTAADLGALFVTANKVANKRMSITKKRVRILPDFDAAAERQETAEEEPVKAEAAAVPKLNLDDIEEFSTPEFQHRLSASRSKKPVLETIVEEPVFSR
ncbi:OLC1v1010677C1 [Oldenlandia corymbosa var. corymbosa]|uniref:OLC1v1010677C1 n=1 Tax=Oldenlandia corymbosa var. corymbosa TaxID=529605 RepID=A0AAV1DUL5_OLDCO|nr:OLC1v1010677C1 [Oldenlandia corymbosa var. corymbosa]